MAFLSTCARSSDKQARAGRKGEHDETSAKTPSRIAAVEQAHVDKPDETAPVSPLHSPRIPSDTKAIREYEYDRQRTKKVADRVKAKDQKQHHAGAKGAFWGFGQSWKAKGSGDMEVWFGWMEQVVSPKVELDGLMYEVKDESGTALDANREVMLEELMRSAKVRKGAAGDFELIPKVKPVLVLDDIFDSQELDEPWEHVSASSSDDEDSKAPSYAQVLCGGV